MVRQFRLKTPLLNLRAFGHAQFGYAVIVMASNIFLFLGMELLMPMYAQQVLMLSATVTGLVLLPGSIAQALLMPVFGTLLDRRGGAIRGPAGHGVHSHQPAGHVAQL